MARVAGVSGITVSRVPRDAGPIATETRARVLDAVRPTGYVHDRLAGGLASARSDLVGVVLPSLSNSVFPDVMAGITAALASFGLQPIVGVTDYDLAAERRVDGPRSVAGGRAALAALLAEHPHVDVVVFSNDDMAVGGVFHCVAVGIRPRQQFGLFGFNGLGIGAALPLSIIRSNC